MDITEFSHGLMHKWTDTLSKITDLTFLSFNDEKYIPRSGAESRLCRLLQEQSAGRLFCGQDCTLPMIQAVKKGEMVFFKCYANLNSVAIPIHTDTVSQNKCIIVGGRILASYDDLVGYRNIAEKMGCEHDSVLDVIKHAPVKELSHFQSAMEAVRSASSFFLRDGDHSKAKDDQIAKLQTIITVASSAGTITDSREYFATILNAIGVLFNIGISMILIRNTEEQRFEVKGVFGYDPEYFMRIKSTWTQGLLGEAMERNEVITSSGLHDILRSGLPNGFKTVNVFPISVKNRVDGLIVILDTAVAEKDAALMGSFCKAISSSLESRIISEKWNAIERSGGVVLGAIRSISSSTDSEDMYNVIVEKSSEIVGAENGSLMLLGDDNCTLEVKATKGLNQSILDQVRISPGEGISGIVLEKGVAMVVSNIEKDHRISRPNRVRYKTKSFASLPLRIRDRNIGVLNFADKKDGSDFSDNDLNLLETVALYSAVAIERRIYYQSSLNLRKISITDPVTDLLNRRCFEERISEEMERSKRHRQPFSLIIMDLDNFKEFNDTYGHLAGDEALKSTGHIIRRCIRIIDIAARYGGEEFAIILPTTDKEDAQLIAHRIRDGIEQSTLPLKKDGQPVKFTVSVGIATYPRDASTIEELINNADRALYKAKGLGKNRVVRFGDF